MSFICRHGYFYSQCDECQGIDFQIALVEARFREDDEFDRLEDYYLEIDERELSEEYND